MLSQKSYAESEYGKLYIVPTPIGNLDDMTVRALKTLEEVDLIAAEDTRHTMRLLNHFNIKTKLTSYHEHTNLKKEENLLSQLKEGTDIALVSDAGMPGISDPGFDLIEKALDKEIAVITLPGANAGLVALVSSGLPMTEFTFYGFLPRKKKEKQAELLRLKKIQSTLIIYESPYRIKETLKEIQVSFGDRKISLARELTKLHETYLRGQISDVLQELNQKEVKGECCLVIEGNDEEEAANDWWKEMSIQAHVAYYEKKEYSHKEAMKKVSLDRGISRRDVYQKLHVN